VSITTEIITLSPGMAESLLTRQIHNRPKCRARVAQYVNEIKDGRWGINGQGIIISAGGRMIDGQHRCYAVIESGISIKTMLVKGVSESAFDIIDQGRARGVADVLGVANSKMVASALRTMFRDHFGISLSHSVKVTPRQGRELLELHPKIVESASWVAGHKALKAMLFTGAACYAHYKAGTIDASMRDTFFERLTDGIGLNARSPILALRNALITVTGRKHEETHQVALMIKAWRAFRDGRSVSFIRYSPGASEAYPKWEG
jgi:hypothetical protein